jgi:hypothetical protein
VAFYSEARRVVTEKIPFPYTPAQHAGLLHPLKSQGRVTVARILPEPVGWTEQCWEPWELEAVLARGGPVGCLPCRRAAFVAIAGRWRGS